MKYIRSLTIRIFETVFKSKNKNKERKQKREIPATPILALVGIVIVVLFYYFWGLFFSIFVSEVSHIKKKLRDSQFL